ncbi:MAG: family 43 glycosylhydrolase [Armatimonadota bacterium]
MNILEFEATLFELRERKYRHPEVDVIGQGFRPVSGKCADFTVVEHEGRYHFFYIERRLVEGTPFYPGNEIYFGHASTANFFDWEVHDPVMLIRPGTWEGAHVWAPCIMKYRGQYVMAYTGVNNRISQNIGLAFSDDLFEWKRWEGNPISPCKDRAWAAWWEDRICSCRDPHIFEYKGRVWMSYTANTKEGASCVALVSTDDLEHWEDHGPILVGPSEGYECRLEGGHVQGSLESTNLLTRNGKWYLLVSAAVRGTNIRHWIFESDRMDRFDFNQKREFWREGGGVEIVKEHGSKSLIAGMCSGYIGFGEVDWSEAQPVGRSISSREQLEAWTR